MKKYWLYLLAAAALCAIAAALGGLTDLPWWVPLLILVSALILFVIADNLARPYRYGTPAQPSPSRRGRVFNTRTGQFGVATGDLSATYALVLHDGDQHARAALRADLVEVTL